MLTPLTQGSRAQERRADNFWTEEPVRTPDGRASEQKPEGLENRLDGRGGSAAGGGDTFPQARGEGDLIKGIFRRIRGAIGNALVWAAGWAAGSLVLSTLSFFVIAPPVSFLPFALVAAVNSAALGFLGGGAFSVYLGIVGRNKRLEELNATRFGLGGAVVAGAFVPVFTTLLFGVGGLSMPLAATVTMTGMAALMGGVTAFGTIKIAQRGAREITGPSMRELEAEQEAVRALLD